ncbi:hypothetical protein HPB49_012917 [Dermacentor silvarum]|uniref:Uncharacterized protein n=1 Tax=Dermacentor silvarum TaxID=543639 RepID=A0ACB8E0K2_DERSI|nr:uncharacterized protein LOC119462471 [Dermacentor silvarum]KAH7980051.1 hypothetical protein HPB49_012917 [Dermacentor silvarum]
MSLFFGSSHERFLKALFVELVQGDTGLINAHKLHRALTITITYHRYRVISRKTTSMLMKLVDRDHPGILTKEQFFHLHRVVVCLWKSFIDYDRNNSGWIRRADIRAAMASVNLQLTDDQVNEVLGSDRRRVWITLDYYLQLCATCMLYR